MIQLAVIHNAHGVDDLNQAIHKLSGVISSSFPRSDQVIGHFDAYVFIQPRLEDFQQMIQIIKMGKSIFMMHPIPFDEDRIKYLVKLSVEAGVFFQISQPQRYNPAFLAAREHIANPLYIEVCREIKWRKQGILMQEIMNILLQDVSIVLSAVKSQVKKISAGGISIENFNQDLYTARLEFHNGCIANLLMTSISDKDNLTGTFFLHGKRIVVDFYGFRASTMEKDSEDEKLVTYDLPISFDNPYVKELSDFMLSINHRLSPEFGMEEGYQSVKIALEILEKIQARAISA